MQLGMVGLGRMGANIGRRLMTKGHALQRSGTQPEAAADQCPNGCTWPPKSLIAEWNAAGSLLSA